MKTDFKNMRSRPCLSHSKANLYNKMCVYVNAMSPDDHQPPAAYSAIGTSITTALHQKSSGSTNPLPPRAAKAF